MLILRRELSGNLPYINETLPDTITLLLGICDSVMADLKDLKDVGQVLETWLFNTSPDIPNGEIAWKALVMK